MNKYRIVKITLKNKKEYYIIQKHTRFFWIGPKIWESYQDVYDGYHCSHDGWSWFKSWGDKFSCYEFAEKELKRIIECDSCNTIIDDEIIKEFTI